MSDVKIPVDKQDVQDAVKSVVLRKDVIVVVTIGLLFLGIHFMMSKEEGAGPAAQPGTQAWCVMNGQKTYRELMREYGFVLPQAQGLLKQCEKMFEDAGGENAKIFKEQQDGMKNATTPVTTGSY